MNTQHLRDVISFHRRHKAVSVMVWLTAWIVTAPFAGAFSGAALLAGLLAGLTLDALSRYEKQLDTRIASHNGGPIWQVSINGVTVGEMKDSAYASIRRSIYFDVRVYVRQLLNVTRIFMLMFDRLFVAIPVGVFWLVVASFFLTPESFTAGLATIHSVTPAQAVAAIPMLLSFIFLVSILTLGALLLCGNNIGFVNQFDLACSDKVRREMKSAADGDVSLYRFVGDVLYVPDEFEYIRAKR